MTSYLVQITDSSTQAGTGCTDLQRGRLPGTDPSTGQCSFPRNTFYTCKSFLQWRMFLSQK